MGPAVRSSLALLLAALFVGVQAAPKTVTVNWVLPLAKTNYALCSGDTLKIKWSGPTHNLWSMASSSCTAKKGLLLGDRSSGTWSKVLTTGTYFYACQFASHCQTANMKIKVTVTACRG